MKHGGRCHCKAIGFEVETERPVAEWSVRACQCTFCRAHAALSMSDPNGALAFVEGGTLVRYEFGLRTAEFLLCGRCGVYVGARTEIGGKWFGIVNVRALVDGPKDVVVQAMEYDGETVETRNARRAQRWTPVRRSL
jgi:hypothetical protein